MHRRTYWLSIWSILWTPVFAVGEPQPQGLPPEAGLPIITWKDAAKHIGEEVIVQGRIVITRNTGTICFLNFDRARTFTAVVHERNFKKFPTPPQELYAHKLVRIHGKITTYQGRPQIEVARPEQVTILDDELPIPDPPKARQREFDGLLTVASFNVLDLFDSYEDPYRGDDGSEVKPMKELETLAATIRKLDADVVALQEVENRGYLERFVRAMLPDMGYEHVVHFEGNDHRGIDVALLSRLPVGPVTSHRHLTFSDGSGELMKFGRDLLRVRIEPEGFPTFEVFVVHFKSKRGGGGHTERYRVGECEQTRKILREILEKDKNALFLICGDFNDTWDSKPMKILRGEGATALRDFLADVPEGTRSYNKMDAPQIIDFILASPAMGKLYVEKSYRIIDGTVETIGSDHNPVVAQFRLRPRK